MDERPVRTASAEERKRQRIERRKRELRIARIKFGTACAIILLAIILIVVGCTKGCKNDTPVETTAATVSSAETTVATEPPAPTFTYRASDWMLILVDEEHPLDESFSVELSSLRSGAKVNSQCMDNLQEMFDDCREAGLDPKVLSAYISATDQEKQFETKVSELMSIGYTQELAEKEAQKKVSSPNCSEYQTGLALDIVNADIKTVVGTDFSDCKELQWLRENSWKYGFVERYTEAQAARMGKDYEPWHYRFVGKDAAKDMYENDYCLEELVAFLEP